MAQTDPTLDAHGQILESFPEKEPPCEIVADLDFRSRNPDLTDPEYTGDFARTTGYLLDRSRTVRQVFPMLVYDRPSWWVFLHEIDRLTEEEATIQRR